MTGLALLCLVLASSSVELVDETYRIPAGELRYVEPPMPQRTGMLTASVEAERGSDEVRVALLSRGDLERLLRDQAHGVLAATAPGESGLLQHYMPAPGYCSVVMDNRNGYVPAVVRLRVWLDAGWTPGPAVTQLSRRRQVTVIAISFAVFFGIAGWSARRLLQGIRS